MKLKSLLRQLTLASLVTLLAPASFASYGFAEDISVEVVDPYGRQLASYPYRYGDRYNNSSDTLVKRFVEAQPQEAYAIRVTNRSAERVGLVIAVDGRNIITGKRSYLRSKERKYVLEPYQQATYRGWRASKNRINEFYFTDAEESYSAAFGDYSAMGVIAVAAFRDRDRYLYEREQHLESYDRHSRKSAPSARSEKHGRSDSVGTGYGDERVSRTRRVRFDAESRVAATFLLKYEWRETLCQKGIATCRKVRNRFWNDSNFSFSRRGGYVTPPPRYRSRYGARLDRG